MDFRPRLRRSIAITLLAIFLVSAGSAPARAAGIGDYDAPFQSLVSTFENVFAQLVALVEPHHTVTVEISPALWHASGKAASAAAFNSVVAASPPAASPTIVHIDTSPKASPSASRAASAVAAPSIAKAPQEQLASYVTQTDLTTQLQELTNKLTSLVYQNVSAPNSVIATGGITNEIAATNRINQLSGVAITGGTITNATVNGISGLSPADIPALAYLSTSGGSLSGALGIGTTSPSDLFALNGAAYLADITVPPVTTNRLYSNSGNLYWAGNLLGGATTGNWSSDGTNVWRTGGNVGIGTTSPSATLAVNGNGYISGNTTIGSSLIISGGRYNTGNFQLGGQYLWQDGNGNIWTSSTTPSSPTGGMRLLEVQNGPSVPIAGSQMQIDNLLESSTFPLANEAGIWSGKTYSYFGVSKDFTSAYNGTSGPATSLFSYAVNNGSTNDVVAMLGDAVAEQSNSTVFGGNLIARNQPGTTNTKLVGLELDVEPSAGTTVAAGSGGLFINAFDVAMPAPAIQIGTLGGGSFNNGVIVNGVIGSTGTAFGVQTGASLMASGLDLTQGSFSTAAAVLGNNVNAPTLLVRQTSTTSPSANIFAVQNSAATSNFLTVAASGNVGIGTTTPGAPLEVNGASSNVQLRLTRSGTFSGSATLYSNSVETFGISPNGINDQLDLLRATGALGVGTSSPLSTLAVSGDASIGADYNFAAPTNGLLVEGAVGIGTTSPGSLLSLNNIANFTTATSTYYSSGGINLGAGCFAIAGNCLSLGNINGTLVVSQGGTGSTTLSGILKGNGTGQLLSAAAGTDYQSPLTFSYPFLNTSNTISEAWGTTTANTFSQLQTLTGGFISDSSSTVVGNFTSTGNGSFTGATGTSTIASGQGFTVGIAQLVVQQGSGNVGIGTTSPWSNLSVNGSIAFSSQLLASPGSASVPSISFAGATNYGIFENTNNIFFTLAGTQQFGIGSSMLFANSNNGPTMKNATGDSATAPVLIPDRGDTTTGVGAGTTGNINFIVSGSERARFTPSGFAIGTTSPYSRLTIWGPDTASSTLAFNIVNNASTTVFAVFDGGNAQLSGTLTQSSDARLKTNIHSLDASTSLAAINSLTPVAYDWLDPNKGGVRQYGFIAQQVEQVFPNLVSTTSATALTPDGTLGLNYIGLIAPLVEAVQWLSADLSALTGRVSSLEAALAGFAHKFTTDEADVGKLCFTDQTGQTCVTKSQIDSLLSGQPSVQISSPTPPTISGTTTPPSINIQGSNPATINVGDTYTDLGAIVTDNQGHDLGYKTFLDGTFVSNIVIDTSAVATDTIDYVATDTWGNTATSTRTVIVEAATSSVQ